MDCYLQINKLLECDNVAIEESPDFPFCSPQHHEYWKKNFQPIVTNGYGKPRLTVSQMQEKLLEMANEAKFDNEDGQGKLL